MYLINLKLDKLKRITSNDNKKINLNNNITFNNKNNQVKDINTFRNKITVKSNNLSNKQVTTNTNLPKKLINVRIKYKIFNLFIYLFFNIFIF